jgi:hypothetical protein
MFGQLPAPLANDGKADTLIFVAVADDVTAAARRVKELTVRVLLSDAGAKGRLAAERLPSVVMACHDQPGRKRVNVPPRKGIEEQIELRLNNALLGRSVVKGGWLLFRARPEQLAVGNNLVSLRLARRRAPTESPVLVEMIEIDVRYR